MVATSLSKQKNLPAKATLLAASGNFKASIDQLSDRSLFFEYVLGLSDLADACQRCVLAETRKHALAATRGEDEHLLRLLLAEQVKNFADLCCHHLKFELAERAYADAITNATLATDLHDAGARANLQQYYLAYGAFLVSQERPDDALLIIEKMLLICG